MLTIFCGYISPGKIEIWEALVLFALYIVYVTFMKYNSSIWSIINRKLSDNGKVIIASNTITVPSGIFSAGQTVSIYNNTAGNISINRSSVTMYWVTDGTDANRTLATRGVATVLCVGTNTFVITGGLLS